MDAALAKLFEELEKSRHRILSLTKKFAAHELTLQPAPGQWSMAQVIKHLAITETQILEYVKKRMTKDTLPDATFKSWMRYMTVMLALRFRKKIKAPRQVVGPPEGVIFDQADEDWSQVRAEWENTLSQMPPGLLSKELFKHPLAGYMTIGQTLGFMNEHVLHHINQIRRIGRQVAKK